MIEKCKSILWRPKNKNEIIEESIVTEICPKKKTIKFYVILGLLVFLSHKKFKCPYYHNNQKSEILKKSIKIWIKIFFNEFSKKKLKNMLGIL